MVQTARFLDLNLFLLVAAQYGLGKKRGEKKLPQQVVSLLLHPSFSGWTELSLAAVRESVLYFALKLSCVTFCVQRNFPSTMIPDFLN